MTEERSSGRLSVRVGVGLSPLAPGPPYPAFWEMVEALEEIGYDSLWLNDSPGRLGTLAPLPTLAAVAARTERLKLGTNVLALPHRHPVVLARELATLDVLSAGRLLPAGGLGVDLPRELAATGVVKAERGPRVEESVAVMKRLWGGEPVTHSGRYWSFADVVLHPTPTRPRLEFWLGGRAPAALRRIGRVGDGWLASFAGPEEVGEGIATIRAAAADAGRVIDEDHYGATIFSAPGEAELPPPGHPLLDQLRPGLARSDHVAVGAAATRALLERFLAVGVTKFVLNPLSRDPADWLRRLYPAAIEPLERAGLSVPAAAG
ncbi:MAG: TIGR03619 family F420-dependent LLM class oxidoreductase [Actinobacteria bacterium]|nr:TIGR03619 family F420-dependent LLM class oxidoreductase [Actinomycetota bacterium]